MGVASRRRAKQARRNKQRQTSDVEKSFEPPRHQRRECELYNFVPSANMKIVIFCRFDSGTNSHVEGCRDYGRRIPNQPIVFVFVLIPRFAIRVRGGVTEYGMQVSLTGVFIIWTYGRMGEIYRAGAFTSFMRPDTSDAIKFALKDAVRSVARGRARFRL